MGAKGKCNAIVCGWKLWSEDALELDLSHNDKVPQDNSRTACRVLLKLVVKLNDVTKNGHCALVIIISDMCARKETESRRPDRVNEDKREDPRLEHIQKETCKTHAEWCMDGGKRIQQTERCWRWERRAHTVGTEIERYNKRRSSRCMKTTIFSRYYGWLQSQACMADGWWRMWRVIGHT